MAVSKEMIVRASIELLNRDGAPGLTMRNLARALGIKAASLYWHIRDKRELYGEIAELLCGRMVMPEENENAGEYLSGVHRAYRAILLTVRDSVPIFEESVPNTPRRIEIIRAIGGALLKMGVKENNLMTAGNLLNNYVLSFTADECRLKTRTPEEIAAFSAQLSDSDRAAFVSVDDYDGQFDYGLRVLLAGLEKMCMHLGGE
ncbi:MAG: TetR/AcrR family transcriptional regulator C-terminal domain-containing protein [Oscillospiraceae bacterium]|jgi:AcrR family transcriptional regulator|nr:TetR/AcrR family transcriptional regulator C-terminal domain-containing protein [Oscillospiraceae bacterium]